MGGNILLWVGFNIFIVLMLLLDIFVFNKKVHALKIREALMLTGFWVSLAVVFDIGVYLYWGGQYALEFATGYIIEQSLSVDNLFVILLLFTYFRTPTAYQQKVLIWGVLGAIFFRILFILTGVTLINQFHFATYILGAFLVFSSIKMLFDKDSNIDPDKNIAIRIFRKIMPVTRFYEESKFFTYQNKILHATPLFVTLIVIETTDIIFALDSIPAIIAVSTHSFIIYSSNIFAVLGLRALYFALAGVMKLFHFIRYGLSLILIFIGSKILLSGILEANKIQIGIKIDLLIIASILVLSVLLSLIFPEKITVPKHDLPGPLKHPKAEK
jgi:tellurite resistance protein TerC